MLGRQHNRGGAKDRVNPSSKNADLFVRVLNGEINVSAFAAANPVTLPLQDLLGPAVLDLLNVADQFLGVFGNAQEPLLDLFFHHRRAATPADASRRLFVRQDSLFLRTPVHRRLALVRQAAFQHFEKEPLVPFVIVGPVRGDFSPPVIAHAEALHLAFHVCNILFGPLTRLDAPLDRGLLGRLAETVPAHRCCHFASMFSGKYFSSMTLRSLTVTYINDRSRKALLKHSPRSPSLILEMGVSFRPLRRAGLIAPGAKAAP